MFLMVLINRENNHNIMFHNVLFYFNLFYFNNTFSVNRIKLIFFYFECFYPPILTHYLWKDSTVYSKNAIKMSKGCAFTA